MGRWSVPCAEEAGVNSDVNFFVGEEREQFDRHENAPTTEDRPAAAQGLARPDRR
jgi:hypothetical protein